MDHVAPAVRGRMAARCVKPLSNVTGRTGLKERRRDADGRDRPCDAGGDRHAVHPARGEQWSAIATTVAVLCCSNSRMIIGEKLFSDDCAQSIDETDRRPAVAEAKSKPVPCDRHGARRW